MTNLEKAKKEYKFGEYFLSATNNLKSPIRIGIIDEAKHEDRVNEIANIKQWCLDLYRSMNPNQAKDKFEKLDYKFKHNAEFFKNTRKQIARMEYIHSLEKDIVNLDGGVIYCGETKVWAKKC